MQSVRLVQTTCSLTRQRCCRRPSYNLNHRPRIENWRSPACILSSVIVTLVVLWTFWVRPATSLPLDCSSVACSGVRMIMQAMLCSCLSMLSALHYGMKCVVVMQSKGLYNLASSEQPAFGDWQKASLKMRFISQVCTQLCPSCSVSYVTHLSMSHGWVLQGVPPGSAAMNRAGQEEITLMQSTAAPDLPILKAVLELSGSHHDTVAKAAISEQTPAEEQIDAAMAGGTKQHPDPALPLKSLQPQSSETLQAAENLSAEATVKSPPGPLQKEAKLSQLRLEALVNYTHEELQALSNPAGLMGSVLHEAEQKAAAVHPTNVAQAPLLTVVASQLETVSAAEAAANPDTGVNEQQQQQPGTFASLAQKEEEALPEREDGNPGKSSSHASHGQDTAVAATLQQQLDRQKQHGGLASSISESPGSAAARGIPHGLQTGSDRHKAMSSTVSETHPVLQRLMDQAEAQHVANGSQVVHHLMQALHLSGHLHSDQHLPAEHSSLLSTLSHMLHHPTQVGIEARLDSP